MLVASLTFGLGMFFVVVGVKFILLPIDMRAPIIVSVIGAIFCCLAGACFRKFLANSIEEAFFEEDDEKETEKPAEATPPGEV